MLAMIFSGEEHLSVQVDNYEQRIGRLFHIVFHDKFHVTFVTLAPLFCGLFFVFGTFALFVSWLCYQGSYR